MVVNTRRGQSTLPPGFDSSSDSEGEEAEEDAAVNTALETANDEADKADDSEEDILSEADSEPETTRTAPRRRRRRRRFEEQNVLLHQVQVHNLGVLFDEYQARHNGLLGQLLEVGCHASYKSRGARVYGTISSLSGTIATLSVCSHGLDGRSVTNVELPSTSFKRRVPKLQRKEAAEWADNVGLLGGVPELRGHYKHYLRVLRRKHIVEKWHAQVFEELRASEHATNFNYERFSQTAISAGLKAKENHVFVFLFLLQKAKTIIRRPGKYPTYRLKDSTQT